MAERLIIGMSGASGAPLTVELLRILHSEHPEIETHLIVTQGAAPASGSFRAMGMAVVPCSVKTLAGIATGYADSLLLRAADVALKERRKLVLVPRECPMSTLHLRSLEQTAEMPGQPRCLRTDRKINARRLP